MCKPFPLVLETFTFWRNDMPSLADLLAGSKKKRIVDFLMDSQSRSDIGQGLTDSVNRGAIAGLLGGPVDAVSGVVNAGLMGLGYAGNKLGLLGADRMPQPIQKPVGGSEWIGDLLQRGGMVSENRNAPAEMLAGLLAPAAVKGASRAAFAAEQNAMMPDTLNQQYHGQLGMIRTPFGRIPETNKEVDTFADQVFGKAERLGLNPRSGASNVSNSRYVTFPQGDNPDIQLRLSGHGDRHPDGDGMTRRFSVDPESGNTFEMAKQWLKDQGIHIDKKPKPIVRQSIFSGSKASEINAIRASRGAPLLTSEELASLTKKGVIDDLSK